MLTRAEKLDGAKSKDTVLCVLGSEHLHHHPPCYHPLPHGRVVRRLAPSATAADPLKSQPPSQHTVPRPPPESPSEFSTSALSAVVISAASPWFKKFGHVAKDKVEVKSKQHDGQENPTRGLSQLFETGVTEMVKEMRAAVTSLGNQQGLQQPTTCSSAWQQRGQNRGLARDPSKSVVRKAEAAGEKRLCHQKAASEQAGKGRRLGSAPAGAQDPGS